MSMQKYQTPMVGSFLRIYVVILASMFAIRSLCAVADFVWQEVLVWIGVLLVGCVIVSLTSPGKAILTAEGVKEQNWRKKRMTQWSEIIQVSAFEYDGKPALILVRTDGYKLREEDRMIRFYFRNIGKLIRLPDNEITRRYVTEYYGPLDVDLTIRKVEK